MLMFTAAFLLAKTLGVALLARANTTYLWMYLLGDMGLFLLYKVARKDYWHFINVQNTVGAILVSAAFRIGGKVIADFTGKSS